jgi:NhaP-type Na+/H+ or K+/H+ antiporter
MNILVILFAILVVYFFMRGVPMLMSMKVKKCTESKLRQRRQQKTNPGKRSLANRQENM